MERVSERISIGQGRSPYEPLSARGVCWWLLCHMLLWAAMILELDIPALGRSALVCLAQPMSDYTGKDKKGKVDDPWAYC